MCGNGGTPFSGLSGASLASNPPPDAKPSLPLSLPLRSQGSPSPPRTPVSPDGGFPAESSPPTLGVAGETQETTIPREFELDLEIQRDGRGAPLELGRGAWSVVYSAVCRDSPTSTSGEGTPPPSPQRSKKLFAVKSPIGRDAYSILKGEAKLLERLSSTPGSESHLVHFHGYKPDTHSIAMEAVPFSLSTYITNEASAAQKTFSTKTMFDPMLGMPRWLLLAEKLVAGLQWLHSEAHVVHGDVKPQNILLRSRPFCPGLSNDGSLLPFDVLFIDFTSSHDMLPPASSSDFKDEPLPFSALTPPFAAPELLTMSSLTSKDVAPSTSSDIFSLAVTLLSAATGDLLLYPGAGNMQVLAMARDGHRVLEYTRSGPHCSRIPRNGTVERVLSPAVLKDPAARIESAEWLDLVKGETGGS